MIVLNMEYGKDFSGAGLALLLLFIHSFIRVDITEVISVEQNRLPWDIIPILWSEKPVT